jgi:RNA polymerase sigma factor (sigma-70 family)
METIECHYPLIHSSNSGPWHFIQAFPKYLGERLGVSIPPTEFKGDIHLAPLEKQWMSQVHEITRQAVPFWIVNAGGKFDFTAKWWPLERYQAVVDHFAGRILFVQVGEKGHHHPALRGVLDLREKTDLRQLVRLVHHAQGVLWPWVREGDDLALNDLMTRWQEPLTRFLIRYTGSEPDALDLAQDTFVRVYEARARYDARGKFSTWLYTITGNLCRNHARYKTRHPAVSLDAELSPGSDATFGEQLPAAGATPADCADEAERAAAVREAIAALPDEQRTATILFEYEDQSHAEIAAILGCSPKPVETRLYRARQFLRERLAGWLK